MLRSILAVAVGFIVTGVVAMGANTALVQFVPGAFGPGGRVESVAMLLLLQLCVAGAAILGCWLAARLAPHSPMRHALILGVLGLAFNVAGSLAQRDIAPAWYHVLAWALVMPYAWLGGRLREMQLERAATPSMAPAA